MSVRWYFFWSSGLFFSFIKHTSDLKSSCLFISCGCEAAVLGQSGILICYQKFQHPVNTGPLLLVAALLQSAE